MGQQLQHRARQYGLTGAGFADDAERLACSHRQADAGDGAQRAAFGRELDREIVDLEQRPGAHVAAQRGLVIACDRLKADPPASQSPSGVHCRLN